MLRCSGLGRAMLTAFVREECPGGMPAGASIEGWTGAGPAAARCMKGPSTAAPNRHPRLLPVLLRSVARPARPGTGKREGTGSDAHSWRRRAALAAAAAPKAAFMCRRRRRHQSLELCVLAAVAAPKAVVCVPAAAPAAVSGLSSSLVCPGRCSSHSCVNLWNGPTDCLLGGHVKAVRHDRYSLRIVEVKAAILQFGSGHGTRAVGGTRHPAATWRAVAKARRQRTSPCCIGVP